MFIDFTYELPSGQEVIVEADVTPEVPGRMYGAPEDCYPDEHASAEITLVRLLEDGKPTCEIDLDGLMYQAAPDKVTNIMDELVDLAIDKLEDM